MVRSEAVEEEKKQRIELFTSVMLLIEFMQKVLS